MSAYGGTPANGWQEHITHGGMPSLFSQQKEDKDEYLQNLCAQTYLRDIVDRNHVVYTHQLEEITCLLASSVGSLTNAKRIYDTFRSNGEKKLSMNTIHAYLSYLEDAFLAEKTQRYDINGRRYLASHQKHYFMDVCLRNAFLHFRQLEPTHLMENILYNELRIRGYQVDVGIVEVRDEKTDADRS